MAEKSSDNDVVEMNYDEAVIREAIMGCRATLLDRLPAHTLPSRLECAKIISKEERDMINRSGSTSMQQRGELLDILLTKNGRALLKVLDILKTEECGYEDLVEQLFKGMDEIQRARYVKSDPLSFLARKVNPQRRKYESAPILYNQHTPYSTSTSKSPLDPWKRDALVSYEHEFKLHLSLTGLTSRLERPAGGFMTETDRASVEEKEGRTKQVGMIVDILRKRSNEDFDTFLGILRKSGNEVWADSLEKEAEEFKKDYANQDFVECASKIEESSQQFKPEHTSLPSPTRSSSGCFGTGWLSGYYSPPLLSPKEPDTQVIPNGSAHGSTTVFLDSMPAKLQVLSSVLLDKTVYISGVAAHNVPKSDQVHAYSFCTNEWSTLPKGPNYNAHTAVINGRITQIGGRDSKTDAITDVVSTWVEEERRWNQDLLPMPTKRLECGVCHHDNLLLVTGGVMASPEDREKGKVVNTVHAYNINTRCWSTPKALELPEPLRSHHLVVAEEHIYLLSGGTSYPVQDSEKRFNPHAWTAAWSDVIEAINQDASAAPEPSEPAKNMWTPINAPPVLRPTVIPYQNSLISVGGLKGCSPQNMIYEFVKVDGTWIEVGNMRLGRYRHGVVTLGKQDTTLFVAGGFVPGKPMEDEVDEKCSFTEIVLF